MTAKKYTLPRHTLLARQGARTGAFLIDVAIFFAITLLLMSFVLNPILSSSIDPKMNSFNYERLSSNLRIENEKGEIDQIKSDASFEEFRDTLSYYYMNYLTGNNIKDGYKASDFKDENIVLSSGEEVTRTEYYSIVWFNKTILGISDDPDSVNDTGLFTYQKDDLNQYVVNDFGVPKNGDNQEVNTYMQKRYIDAYSDFSNQDYVADLINDISFLYTLEGVISAFIAMIVTYIVFPLCFKNGQTIGKKSFGLALANKEGYKLNNTQLIMRAVPLGVVILAMLVPVWKDLIIILISYLVIFLVSFALAMASPKRMSLHDYTGQTIVIDFRNSIIFNDSVTADEYIAEEDGLKEEKDGEEDGQ